MKLVEKESSYRTINRFIQGNMFERLIYCENCTIGFEFPYKLDETIEYKCKIGNWSVKLHI